MPSSTTPAPAPVRPKVGIAAFVLRRIKPGSPNHTENSSSTHEFVLGLRAGSHGANTWALPGGHLELNEDFAECAAREVLEETGLAVTTARFLTATNDVMLDEGKHYVTVFVVCEVEDETAEPELCEPEKCRAWDWVRWEDLLAWVRAGESESESESECVDGDVVEGAAAAARATKHGDDRKLFLPMVNLVRQRPGIEPTMALTG